MVRIHFGEPIIFVPNSNTLLLLTASYVTFPPAPATFREFWPATRPLSFEERFRGGASSTLGLRSAPAYFRTNSRVSPVDRKRLLTASSQTSSHTQPFQNWRLRILKTPWPRTIEFRSLAASLNLSPISQSPKSGPTAGTAVSIPDDSFESSSPAAPAHAAAPDAKRERRVLAGFRSVETPRPQTQP